jgi:UDP-glucuronate decarboxylase
MNTDDMFTGPVNLGNPEEFAILDLAKKVIALTGSKSAIVFKPLPADDPRQRQPDISLATEKLQWKITVRIDDDLSIL